MQIMYNKGLKDSQAYTRKLSQLEVHKLNFSQWSRKQSHVVGATDTSCAWVWLWLATDLYDHNYFFVDVVAILVI